MVLFLASPMVLMPTKAAIASAFVENPMAFYVTASILGALCVFAPALYQGISNHELHRLLSAHSAYLLVSTPAYQLVTQRPAQDRA